MPGSFKSPLTLYVLWHPNYSDGAAIAQRLFNEFSRNVDDPFARTPGIPVYFRSAPASDDENSPRQIQFGESDHTAIVLLVDDEMVVSPEWREYVTQLDVHAAKSDGKTRLFPVAVNTRSFNFPVANTNFIRLFEVKPEVAPQPGMSTTSREETAKPVSNGGGITVNVFINGGQTESVRTEGTPAEVSVSDVVVVDDPSMPPDTGEDAIDVASTQSLLARQGRFLIGKLVHELSRLLYHVPRVTEKGTVQSAPPVRMFISHAKADGADIAAAIRNQIHADTSLKSFFDANDIAVGYRFSDELLAALEQSAIICLQTDYYATREWCLWEVINAKRLDRPVVVVNAVTDREPRSFPYLGNTPTIRWQFGLNDNRTQIQDVLAMALFEVLGSRFRELFQTELIRTFDLPENTAVVGHPPELFTILKMASDDSQNDNSPDNPRYVVYPEPPLGDEEIRLLEELAPAIRFVTPTMLPLVQHQIRMNSNEPSQ